MEAIWEMKDKKNTYNTVSGNTKDFSVQLLKLCITVTESSDFYTKEDTEFSKWLCNNKSERSN